MTACAKFWPTTSTASTKTSAHTRQQLLAGSLDQASRADQPARLAGRSRSTKILLELRRDLSIAASGRRSRTTRTGCSRASATRSPRRFRCSTRSSTTRPTRGQPEHGLDRPAAVSGQSSRRFSAAPSQPRAPRTCTTSAAFAIPVAGGFVAYLEPFTRDRPTSSSSHKVVAHRSQARGSCTFENGATADVRRGSSRPIPLPDLIPMIAGAPRDVLDARRTAGLHRGRDRQPRHRSAPTSSTRIGPTSTIRTSSSRG